MVHRTKSGRLHCRVCGDLAGVTRDICTGCQMAEVRSHIRRRGRVHESTATSEDVHDAYRAAIETRPVSSRQLPSYTPETEPEPLPEPVAAKAATSPANVEHAAHLGVTSGQPHWAGATLSHAAQMSVTLGIAGTHENVTALFYSYSRRTFYHHLRAILRSLETGLRRYDPKKRKNPTKKHSASARAQSRQNIALAMALRFTRIFLQEEMNPLALKINCGHATIWRIEQSGVVIAPYWVERYAVALKLSETNLWAFADYLTEKDLEPAEMVTAFVDIVLRGKIPSDYADSSVREHQTQHARYSAPNDVRLLVGLQ